MADVRALLRSEQASRRISHPNAAYSSSGALTCSLCRIAIKSETLWDKHLRSPMHKEALKNLQHNESKTVQEKPSQNSSNGRKRKASDAGEVESDVRKKARGVDSFDTSDSKYTQSNESTPNQVVSERPLPIHASDVNRKEVNSNGVLEQQSTQQKDEVDPIGISEQQIAQREDEVNEAEWAAFERAVATPPPEETAVITSTSIAALNAVASIQAAPRTAQEIAAQAREEQSTQKDSRQAEIENDKEEAARQLETEFEEMEELESRVLKLKNRREALRNAHGVDEEVKEMRREEEGSGNAGIEHQTGVTLEEDEEEAEDHDGDSESDEVDEWATWR